MATLAGAGMAAASYKSQTTQQASATFAAAAVTQSRLSTCTSTDGVYQDTTATYTGTSTSSDARLNGRHDQGAQHPRTRRRSSAGSPARSTAQLIRAEHVRRHRRRPCRRPGDRLPARQRPPQRGEADGELLRRLHARRRIRVRPARRGQRNQRGRVLRLRLGIDGEAPLGDRRVPPRVECKRGRAPGQRSARERGRQPDVRRLPGTPPAQSPAGTRSSISTTASRPRSRSPG